MINKLLKIFGLYQPIYEKGKKEARDLIRKTNHKNKCKWLFKKEERIIKGKFRTYHGEKCIFFCKFCSNSFETEEELTTLEIHHDKQT